MSWWGVSYTGIWGLSRKYPPTYYEKWRHYGRRYKIQETLYIGQWCLRPLQSRHLGTSHSSPNHHQLPCPIFLNLINDLKSLHFQRWFYFWEKAEVSGLQIWALEGLSHLSDLMFCQKSLHKTRCVSGYHAWWSCQSPVAFWNIWMVFVEEYSSVKQNFMQIICSDI